MCINTDEFRVGSTREHLDRWESVSLTLICRLGQGIIDDENRIPENQDWLELTKAEYNGFRPMP
jgi:hypothetical protein